MYGDYLWDCTACTNIPPGLGLSPFDPFCNCGLAQNEFMEMYSDIPGVTEGTAFEFWKNDTLFPQQHGRVWRCDLCMNAVSMLRGKYWGYFFYTPFSTPLVQRCGRGIATVADVEDSDIDFLFGFESVDAFTVEFWINYDMVGNILIGNEWTVSFDGNYFSFNGNSILRHEASS